MPIRSIEHVPFTDPRVKLEKILKPLETYQQRRDQALAALRAPPEEEETRFCWGGPAQFTLDDIPSIGPGFTTKDKEKEKEEAPPNERKILDWNEDGREWKKIRVENPDDPEQYVIIHRIEKIVFTPPGEDIKEWNRWPHRFSLRHPDKKQK